ncbi:MAG: Maf family protein [Caulobacterales bacterium]|nr:Maf family protein [Caulobacterales bacterium]
MTLILASRSAARRQMLEAAGVTVSLDAADLDEGAIKGRLLSEGATPAAVAQALAGQKAMAVSSRRPGVLVLGSDQTLELDGTLYDKAASLDEARARLVQFSGRSHRLHSGAALARDGQLIWTCHDAADLTVRSLSPAFIDAYLSGNGEAALSAVGGYWLEGEGVQLFEQIRGDYFTILGLPLLPVLAELRRCGELVS